MKEGVVCQEALHLIPRENEAEAEAEALLQKEEDVAPTLNTLGALLLLNQDMTTRRILAVLISLRKD